jgi:hypothetical protein
MTAGDTWPVAVTSTMDPGSRTAILPGQRTAGGYGKPGFTQQLCDSIGLEPVEVKRHHMAERLRQVAGLVADLEREQQVPARCQCAMEFGEHRRQFLWWCVDDRVPRDDTAESTIRCVHSGD